jgi:Ca-activated chloride channel family protein
MKRAIVAVIIVLTGVAALEASTAGKIRAGNRSYKKEQFEKALDAYRQAEITAPANPVVHFNIGDALHKSNSYDDAAKEYQRALAGRDPLLRSKAYFNLGNNAFRQEKTDEALDYYKKALELNPNDTDAKYNIEYILTKKALQKDSKQDKDGKGKGNDKQQKQNDKQDRNGQKKEQKEGNEGREKEKQGMSKEDAKRILQYYNDAEKNAAQKRKMQMPQLPKVDEDW